jgi:hypothetical protein
METPQKLAIAAGTATVLLGGAFALANVKLARAHHASQVHPVSAYTQHIRHEQTLVAYATKAFEKEYAKKNFPDLHGHMPKVVLHRF